MNRFSRLALPLAFVAAASTAPLAHAGPGPVLTTLMTRPLPEYPGKEMHAITVVYPPGGSDPVHRHDAHAMVYVLEGSVVMGVRGLPEVTLTPGQIWYESPGDVHTVSRNASVTEPAKFLVVFLKKRGVDAVLPSP